MKIKKAHCFFEQSGTFKREFIKHGIEAYDYDILNDFGETDYIIDLFGEINKAYMGKDSLFDNILPDDLIFAFFPCVRFENQIQLCFRGDHSAEGGWSLEKKLRYNMKLHEELSNLYDKVIKLALVCLRKNLHLIIENPYSTQHYLVRYSALKPTIIDGDRTKRGDAYKKPTQYIFVNCAPENNFCTKPIHIAERKTIKKERNPVKRSMITPEYAERFLEEFIL